MELDALALESPKLVSGSFYQCSLLCVRQHYKMTLRNLVGLDFCNPYSVKVEGMVASWLVCLSLDQAVQVRVLARDSVLCSWARHYTLTVPLSTQVYKWLSANLMLGVTLRWTSKYS